MQNARLDEAQTGIKIAGRNNNNLRYAVEKEMAAHSSTLGLENPGDREAWWAAVCGVTQSRTRLK